MSPSKKSQVADRLREQIRAGKWKPGERLPTQKVLAVEFGMSAEPIREAIAQLVDERLVWTSTSAGTVVQSRRVLDHVVTDFIAAARKNATTDVFVETALAGGRKPGKEFQMRMEPASAEVAQWLGLAPQDWVVIRTVTQILDGQTWAWEVSYYPRDLAEKCGLDDPNDIPEGTTRRLQERGHTEIAWRDQNYARPATPEEADKLSITTTTWIQEYVRIGAAADRITRATKVRRVADMNRVVHELGDITGLTLIRNALNSTNSPEGAEQ